MDVNLSKGFYTSHSLSKPSLSSKPAAEEDILKSLWPSLALAGVTLNSKQNFPCEKDDPLRSVYVYTL